MVPSLDMVPLTGVFANCSFWQLWPHVCFGFFGWVSILGLRFARLYLVFRLKVRWPTWKMNLLFLPMWVPSLFYAVFGTIFADDVFGPECFMNTSFYYALAAYAAVFLVLYVFFMVTLRGVRHRLFNEYAEMVRAVFLLLGCYVTFVVLVGVETNEVQWSRCLAFSTLQFLQSVAYVSMLGYPLYMSFKDPKGFENFFHGRETTRAMETEAERPAS
jgi:hypothetical protein